MDDSDTVVRRAEAPVALHERNVAPTGADDSHAVVGAPSSPHVTELAFLPGMRAHMGSVQRWSGHHATFPTWLPATWKNAWIGYVASAIVTTITAGALTALSIATHGSVQLAAPLLLLDILVALTFGPGPSLLAALLGTVLIDYFINPPHFAWSHTDPGKAITLVVLALVGCAISLLASRAAHARSEAEVLAEELRASESETTRLMDEFLGVASHELKTPLTSILTNVQLAARKAQTLEKMMRARSLDLDALERMPGELALMLQRTERQARRQDRLVNELLEMSRARSGKLELALTECDLAALVRDVADEQRQAYPDRQIDVEVGADDVAGLMVTVDAHRIEQVLTNFLSNALKYSLEAAPVAVTVGSEQDLNGRHWARVAVSDLGPGLSPTQQLQVWDRFYRAPGVSVLSGSGVGLGLGLFIAREIIERHGGHVGVESAPGAGATFWFAVPRA